MGVNSLPKTVTRQRRDCDLNPGPVTDEFDNKHYNLEQVAAVLTTKSASLLPPTE